jgi:hypothetical protein
VLACPGVQGTASAEKSKRRKDVSSTLKERLRQELEKSYYSAWLVDEVCILRPEMPFRRAEEAQRRVAALLARSNETLDLAKKDGSLPEAMVEDLKNLLKGMSNDNASAFKALEEGIKDAAAKVAPLDEYLKALSTLNSKVITSLCSPEEGVFIDEKAEGHIENAREEEAYHNFIAVEAKMLRAKELQDALLKRIVGDILSKIAEDGDDKREKDSNCLPFSSGVALLELLAYSNHLITHYFQSVQDKEAGLVHPKTLKKCGSPKRKAS